MADLTPLRRRMIEDMTIRNLSPATQQSYVHAVAKFSRQLGVRDYRQGQGEDHRSYWQLPNAYFLEHGRPNGQNDGDARPLVEEAAQILTNRQLTEIVEKA